MVMPSPSRVRVRTYQVGFGDCLLITLTYPEPLANGRTDAHLLVDFGTKVLAAGGPTMSELAATITEHCGGHLDVVVVTHRHQDHLRGFGDTAAQSHLDRLEPSMIVRPWTDRPPELRGDLGDASRKFLGLLDTLGDHNVKVSDEFAVDRRVLAERARELAELGVSNVRALARLDSWAAPERTRWVRAADVVDVADTLPGIRVDVLGPPTLEQVPRLKSYASGSVEYWLDLAQHADLEPELQAAVPNTEITRAKQRVAAPGGLGRAAFLLDELRDTGHRQVLEIVEGFEDVLNNTSVILLLTVGRRCLLLAGDAQVENWSYSLDRAYGVNNRKEDPALREQLARVDLYKVGHHGSRNATPRRLVDLWRTARPAGQPLCSVLSTRTGVYGTAAEGKVPKPELIEALKRLGPLHSTETLPEGVWWFDVEAPTSGDAGFDYSAGPPVRPGRPGPRRRRRPAPGH
jgi:hypothetical protein